MMTLRRFRKLADTYGADLQRWPERQRAQALALVGVSEEAQAIITRARELDDAIAAAAAARDARVWDGEGADAPLQRLHENVASRIRQPSPVRVAGLIGPHSPAASRYRPQRVGWVGLATAAGLAVAAGLTLGIYYSPSAPPEDLTALLQPAPLQVLTD